ncbi:MAG: hypothetical protein Q9227_005662 [Pyrenula ochraceoflavens]
MAAIAIMTLDNDCVSQGVSSDRKTLAFKPDPLLLACKMAVQGKKLYFRALLAGSIGFVTFGWDAGVLGGILLTPEFQAAVGVSKIEKSLWNYPPTVSTESDGHISNILDHVNIPSGILARMYDHNGSWYAIRKEDVDFGGQCH